MRVLHLTRDFPPRHRGGISTAVAGLAHAQARAGCDVAVLSFDDWRPRAGGASPATPEAGMENGIATLRITSTQQLDAVRAFAYRFRPTLLHVHHGMLWEFAAALRAELGVPAVKSVHVVQRLVNALRGTQERTLSLAGQEAALAGADRVIVPSRAAAAAICSPALAPRVRVVGHGIDDSPAARAAAAHHVASPAHGPLLAVGRFDDVKGTPELFAAVQTVLARLPDATCIIAGGVPGSQRAEARWLRQWRAQASAPLQARVHHVGWLDAAALAACYRDAAALIVPSRYETFGLVALEAMLHGVPVAATDAGGLAELIVHGDTGLLSPPCDAALLAEHAITLLTDAELAARLARNAAALVRASRLWDHVLPRAQAVYAELC